MPLQAFFKVCSSELCWHLVCHQCLLIGIVAAPLATLDGMLNETAHAALWSGPFRLMMVEALWATLECL